MQFCCLAENQNLYRLVPDYLRQFDRADTDPDTFLVHEMVALCHGQHRRQILAAVGWEAVHIVHDPNHCYKLSDLIIVKLF